MQPQQKNKWCSTYGFDDMCVSYMRIFFHNFFFDHFQETIATTRLKSRWLFFLEREPNSQGDCSDCVCIGVDDSKNDD